MATYKYGNSIKANSYSFYFRSFFTYSISETATTYSITLTAGVDTNPHTDSTSGTVGDIGWNNIKITLTGTGKDTKSTTKNYRSSSAKSTGELTYISSFTWTWNKGTSAATKTIRAKMTCSNLSTSTAEKDFTVPALKTLKITYNGNGATSPSGSSGNLETRTYYYNKDTFAENGLPNRSTWSLLKTDYLSTGYWFNSSNTAKRIHQDTKYATTQALYKAATGNTWDGLSNVTLTLKAEWQLDYTAPSLNIIEMYRTSNNSGDPIKDPSGTYIYYHIKYTNGKSGANALSLTLTIKQGDTTVKTISLTSATASSGDYSGYLSSEYTADQSLSFTVVLSPSGHSNVSKTIGIPAAQYPIDLKVDNNNNIYMGIMGPAEDNRPLKLNLSPTGALIMTGENSTTSNYKNCVYYHTGTYNGGTNDTTGTNKYHAFYVNNTGTLYINETFLQFNTGYFRSTFTNSNPSNTATANLRIESNGDIKKTASSSRRYKCDIEDANLEVFNPHNLYNIPFRQFRYKEGYFGDNADNNTYNKLYQGFIAEEVQECYPCAVDIEDNGEVETWSDRELIPPMLKLIQEQHEEIEALKSRIDILEASK